MSHSARLDRTCFWVVVTVALFVFSVGCERTHAPELIDAQSAQVLDDLDSKSPLDQELKSLLVSHSNGAGVDFFRLPRSNQLHRIPQDPLNPLTTHKVRLGKFLFNETALAMNNVRPEGEEAYSCGSCHLASGRFAANVPQGMAEGGMGFGLIGEGRVFNPTYDSNPDMPDCQPIRTPSFLNGAYQELMLWNGAFGGVGDNIGTEAKWAAGSPLESNWLGMQGLESQAHGGLRAHRMEDVESSRITAIPEYQRLFRKAFPGEAEPINRLNTALAIAAFERTVLANEAPFQKWLQGNTNAMTEQEKRGAIVFFGNGNCVGCHTGPGLNSMTFNAMGMKDLDGAWDMARVNLAPFGGTVPDDARRGRGGFTGNPDDDYKFKTPPLYNLLDGPFYGHGASFSSIRDVVLYMNAGIPENPLVPVSQLAPEFQPLGLTNDEIDDVVSFLETALYDDDLMRYQPTRLPSGNCFPVNDPMARVDLGCESPMRVAHTPGELGRGR
jgi:cytochrome c peroxidase